MFALCALPLLKESMPLNAPSPSAPTPEDLLTRVGRDKDRASFVRLFQYFAPRVKSYLLKHGADNAQAEEIVQNTFITVWEKAAHYAPEKSAASTWIFTIARNKRIDMLRREKHFTAGIDDLPQEMVSYTPEEKYADASTIKTLNTAIGTLPEDQARLLRMAFFEDKSHHAIAEQTKIPLGTVKSRIRIALAKLKKALQKRDEQHAE